MQLPYCVQFTAKFQVNFQMKGFFLKIKSETKQEKKFKQNNSKEKKSQDGKK